MISILYNLFQKIEAEGIFPNSLYEASINYPNTKPRQRQGKNKLQTKLLMTIDAKILNKIFIHCIQVYKKNYIPQPSDNLF